MKKDNPQHIELEITKKNYEIEKLSIKLRYIEEKKSEQKIGFKTN